MTAKIGVLADTHIPQRTPNLPGVLFHAFAEVDLILHAGDITELDVLEELRLLAPVHAVCGNMDSGELKRQLPLRRVVEREGFKLGLIHGHNSRSRSAVQHATAEFCDEDVDCIVFGHSHRPFKEYREDVLLFNPGSPTDPRSEPHPTFGLLILADSLRPRLFQFEPESNMVLGELD